MTKNYIIHKRFFVTFVELVKHEKWQRKSSDILSNAVRFSGGFPILEFPNPTVELLY